MTHKKKTIFPGLLSLALLLAVGQLAAQCDFTGQVIGLSGSPACSKVILSYSDFEILVPQDASALSTIGTGAEIQFSYTLDTVGQACTAGVSIELTCIEVTSQPTPDCTAEFIFFTDFNADSPMATFQALTVDDDLQYTWNFDNGDIAYGPTVAHTFPGQGSYEVCLTLSGGNCEQVANCQTVDLNECRAAFYAEGNDGTVSFFNTSFGNYTDWEWSLGNGTELQNTYLETYDYGETNIYTVCLTVWNNNGCTSKYCNYVFTGSGDVCEFATCVYPGDTNTDGAANVYDLLQIGVGHGTEGPPRQVDDVELAIDWVPQYAPDWGLETINGNDYKHLDCNGDGNIDGDDVEAIEVNYAAPSNTFMVQSDGAPTVWLDFEWDTILIDDNTPETIELEADLMIGTPDLPMDNLRGFALQMDYPEDKVVDGGVEVDYNDNSFFGSSNNIIWLQKDRHGDGGEFDLGFTKKSAATTGFGKIATVKFIVISDVLARDQTATPFTVSLKDVVAVNPDGAMLTVGALTPATIYVVNKITTSTNNEWLNSQVTIFPNPATEKAIVRIQDLKTEQLEVFNSLGQKVQAETGRSDYFELNTAGWERGIYLVKIQTDQGIANKRLVVQ